MPHPCARSRNEPDWHWAVSTITLPVKMKSFEAIIVDKHPYKKLLPAILAAEGETVEDFLRNAAHHHLD